MRISMLAEGQALINILLCKVYKLRHHLLGAPEIILPKVKWFISVRILWRLLPDSSKTAIAKTSYFDVDRPYVITTALRQHSYLFS